MHFKEDDNDSQNSSSERVTMQRIDSLLKTRIFNRMHQMQFSKIKKFKADFWMICALAILEKISIQPFIQNAGEMFQTKFNLDLQETGTIIAFPFIVFIFLGPFQGWITDKKGYKGYVLIAGFIILSIAHIVFVTF